MSSVTCCTTVLRFASSNATRAAPKDSDSFLPISFGNQLVPERYLEQGNRGTALTLDHDIEGKVHRNGLIGELRGAELNLANGVYHAFIQHLVD